MNSAELYARARDLESLADDVEVAFDAVHAVAASPEWQCANAEDVRSAIAHYRRAAQTAAGNLRDEARRVRQRARDVEDREREKEHSLPVMN